MKNIKKYPLKMSLIGWYSIFLGVTVIFLWALILKPFEQNEGKLEMGFHLMSEFLMACLCIVSGIKILLKHRESFLVNSAAHGMVLYSTANAAGFYGEGGSITMMIIFLVLFLVSLIIIVNNFRGIDSLNMDKLR